MATIEFACPACSQKLACDAKRTDVAVRCQRCEHKFRPVDAIDRDVPLPAVAADERESEAEARAALTPERPKPSPKRQGTLLMGSAGGAAVAESQAKPPQRTGGESESASVTEPACASEARVGEVAEPRSGEQSESESASEGARAKAGAGAGAALRPASSRRAPTVQSRKRRTTLHELSEIAERLTLATDKKLAPSIGTQLAVATGVGVTLALLTGMALATGTWRWLLAIVGFAAISALLVWGGLKLLPKIAKRLGHLELPGRAWAWLGGGASALAAIAGLLTWGLSEATASFAQSGLSDVEATVDASAPPAEPPKERADAKLKRQGHVRAGPGVLHVPPTFASEDGSFDLVMHFHGNVKLVEESVAEAGINALVHITNLGEGSGPYERRFDVPKAFEDMIAKIEQRAQKEGLRDARVNRIALASWSAGYGSVAYILKRKPWRQRVDAVLLMDSMHAKYLDAKERTIHGLSIAPFVAFAKQASAGQRLFVLTHSEIETYGYATTTEAADALLSKLDLQRVATDPSESSPPEVTFETALKAMPKKPAQWMQTTSLVNEKHFHLMGCSGKKPEAHMAHLVQMSVSVLPYLAERWKP